MRMGGADLETWAEACLAVKSALVISYGPGNSVIVIAGPVCASGPTLVSAFDAARMKLEETHKSEQTTDTPERD